MPYYRRKKSSSSTKKRSYRDRSSMRKGYRKRRTARKTFKKKAASGKIKGYKRVSRGRANQFQRKMIRGTQATEIKTQNDSGAGFVVVPISIPHGLTMDRNWREQRPDRLDMLFEKLTMVKLIEQMIDEVEFTGGSLSEGTGNIATSLGFRDEYEQLRS